MDSVLITDEQLLGLQFVADAVKDLRSKALRMVVMLGEGISNNYSLGDGALTITALVDEDTIAKVDSPVGEGRLKLFWGSDGEGIVAKLTLQRKERDPVDQIAWRNVWQLNIPAKGSLYTTLEGKRLNLSIERASSETISNISLISASFLHALINAPHD